jgi:hypothetical protein
MKNKFKIMFSFVTILFSTICHGQSEGVPEEIQNILIGRWVPTERVCLRAELNGIGNLIRKKNNSLSGNYWLLKDADINNIEPVLVRKYQITSGKIIDSSQKIYEIRGVDEDVINNTKFEFIQVFKLLNNFTRTTIDYIRNDKVLTKDSIDLNTKKTNQSINCESPEMVAKKEDRDKSNQEKLLAKQQKDMMLAKQEEDRIKQSQQYKNIEKMNDSQIISYINSANDSELRLTSEYLSSELQKMKTKNIYYGDTERGKHLSRIQNAVDQTIRSNEIQISNRINNERERQNQIDAENKLIEEKNKLTRDKPLTEKQKKEVEKLDREIANAFVKLLGNAFEQDRKNEVRTNAGWCVNAQGIGGTGINATRVTSITTNSMGFQINFKGTGFSGGDTINCNHSQNHRFTTFTAQCYRC